MVLLLHKQSKMSGQDLEFSHLGPRAVRDAPRVVTCFISVPFLVSKGLNYAAHRCSTSLSVAEADNGDGHSTRSIIPPFSNCLSSHWSCLVLVGPYFCCRQTHRCQESYDN